MGNVRYSKAVTIQEWIMMAQVQYFNLMYVVTVTARQIKETDSPPITT